MKVLRDTQRLIRCEFGSSTNFSFVDFDKLKLVVRKNKGGRALAVKLLPPSVFLAARRLAS